MALPESACVFVVRDGRVLSVIDHRGYGLPGGKVEPGETAKTAAARECFEETGMVAGGLRFLYEGECDGYWCTTYLAMQFSGEPRDMGVGRVEWVLPDQLLAGKFADYNKPLLAAYRKRMYGA